MDLKTFVSQSLTQIIQGVEEAQLENKNSIINSKNRTQIDGIRSLIDFDIAVTIEKETGKQGGITVFGGAVNFGGAGQSKSTDLSVSRIKFSVPIDFQKKYGMAKEAGSN